MNETDGVVVIGAGQAGLATSHELLYGVGEDAALVAAEIAALR